MVKVLEVRSRPVVLQKQRFQSLSFLLPALDKRHNIFRTRKQPGSQAC
jgi:hypothetical protein